MANRKWWARVVTCAAWVVLAGVAIATVSFLVIRAAAQDRIVDEATRVPFNEVGLVLGTSKFTHGNRPNLIFDHRMAAAAGLYHAGRVRSLLLSGNNDHHGYNEPADMKASLLTLGVPPEALIPDDAGYRTLDSVVRTKQVFGQSKVTIITDRFHAYRALFLAQHEGLDAVAFPSEDVELRSSIRAKLRECGADVKTCLDVWVLHTRPRVLGEPVAVHLAGR